MPPGAGGLITFDLWSLCHVAMGFVLGDIAARYKLSPCAASAVIAIALVGWELLDCLATRATGRGECMHGGNMKAGKIAGLRISDLGYYVMHEDKEFVALPE